MVVSDLDAPSQVILKGIRSGHSLNIQIYNTVVSLLLLLLVYVVKKLLKVEIFWGLVLILQIQWLDLILRNSRNSVTLVQWLITHSVTHSLTHSATFKLLRLARILNPAKKRIYIYINKAGSIFSLRRCRLASQASLSDFEKGVIWEGYRCIIQIK